jgi:uncharacterized protein (DUF433 family)
MVDARQLLDRITVDPQIFGGKPIIRGRRLAVEHVLGMLAAGDTLETLLDGYPWLEREDILSPASSTAVQILERSGQDLDTARTCTRRERRERCPR